MRRKKTPVGAWGTASCGDRGGAGSDVPRPRGVWVVVSSNQSCPWGTSPCGLSFWEAHGIPRRAGTGLRYVGRVALRGEGQDSQSRGSSGGAPDGPGLEVSEGLHWYRVFSKAHLGGQSRWRGGTAAWTRAGSQYFQLGRGPEQAERSKDVRCGSPFKCPFQISLMKSQQPPSQGRCDMGSSAAQLKDKLLSQPFPRDLGGVPQRPNTMWYA